MAMQTHKRTHYLLEARHQTLEVELDPRDATALSLSLLPATAVERAARQIAIESVEQMDEGKLIGYPPLGPEQRAFYEVTIRMVAERVIDR